MISASITGAIKSKVLAIQEFTFLLIDAVRDGVTQPRYFVDTLIQMDVIGVGS